MPTVFIIHGFRFFFFSNEGTELIHVHVEKADKACKFWLTPVGLARNYKFTSVELRKIMDIIEDHKKRNRGEME